MPTVVVSGRVDEDVKLRADAVLRAAGSSVARVINDVWRSIAESGELPAATGFKDEQAEKRATFHCSWSGSTVCLLRTSPSRA